MHVANSLQILALNFFLVFAKDAFDAESTWLAFGGQRLQFDDAVIVIRHVGVRVIAVASSLVTAQGLLFGDNHIGATLSVLPRRCLVEDQILTVSLRYSTLFDRVFMIRRLDLEGRRYLSVWVRYGRVSRVSVIVVDAVAQGLHLLQLLLLIVHDLGLLQLLVREPEKIESKLVIDLLFGRPVAGIGLLNGLVQK